MADSDTQVLTVKVPDVGEGIAEVELVSWSVSEGQTVTRDQIVAEVMTDKATVEVPAPVDGVVQTLSGDVGETLLVGSPLFALTTNSDGTAPAEVQAPATPAPVAPASVAPTSTPDPVPTPVQATKPAAAPALSSLPALRQAAPLPEGRRPTATPAVRRRARDAGIDLRTVRGTGPAGRITHEDLDAVFAGAASASGSGHADARRPRVENSASDDQPIVGMRRKIAEQMVASTSTIPHITYVEEIDMTALEDLRKTLNDQALGEQTDPADASPKLTLLPFLTRALVNQLPQFPSMNAHVIESASEPDVLRSIGGVHVGIATQTDGGLVVPVIRHAESLSLWGIARRIGELAESARAGTAERSELTGSTITITSLGALGGLVTTPVINKPETTIIGVNKMVVRPVWIDDQFVPRKMMNLSSSFDHRVIDGWDAARFVQAIKRELEQPALLFVDRPERP